MPHTWRVVVRGQVADEQLAALPSDQMVWVSGHHVGGQRSATIWVRAADADAASEIVRSELSTIDAAAPRLAVTEAIRVPYGVTVGVPEEDAPALERALTRKRRETGNIGPLMSLEASAGLFDLTLEADGDSDEEARRKALAEYAELRTAAGLPPGEPGYAIVYPPWQPERQRHRELFERAQALCEAGETSLAVVIAQAAFEALIRQTVEERLLAREIGGLRDHLHNYKAALQESQSRKLWLELTHDEIGRHRGWNSYLEHVKRRNDLVHEGVEVDQAGACASISAVLLLLEHIESLVPPRTDE